MLRLLLITSCQLILKLISIEWVGQVDLKVMVMHLVL
ncbi:hypothetical protein HERIO_2795 [Hepatospora eriocheir]|uniref:Uncharacterized protein n=1 Tax=Hepatospora eriocheir TaxID=1081669 RepID=A0A1X0Q602_9MICR|nr:hypothetical protein HERIO_2795 [Hepatospora eriocheir]